MLRANAGIQGWQGKPGRLPAEETLQFEKKNSSHRPDTGACPVHGCCNSRRLANVALGNLDTRLPRTALQPKSIAHKAPDPVAESQQLRNEPAADISRGASDQDEWPIRISPFHPLCVSRTGAFRSTRNSDSDRTADALRRFLPFFLSHTNSACPRFMAWKVGSARMQGASS